MSEEAFSKCGLSASTPLRHKTGLWLVSPESHACDRDLLLAGRDSATLGLDPECSFGRGTFSVAAVGIWGCPGLPGCGGHMRRKPFFLALHLNSTRFGSTEVCNPDDTA